MNISDFRQQICHDAADEDCRSPLGALRGGTTVRLSLRGAEYIEAADCLLWSEGGEQSIPMQREERLYTLRWTAPETPSLYFYCFRLRLCGQELWLCPAGGRFGRLMSSRGDGFRLTVYDRDFRTPAWFRRSVMYQIFPDRFARDAGGGAARGMDYHRALGRDIRYHESWEEPVDWLPNSADGFYFPLDFYGGTLRGIEDRLPYLASLGVGVIYLNPIFEACSNHRYDTADYLRIDPILGTEEDFKSLCASAEALGIRLLLDGVFSHTGADSRYFNRFSRYEEAGAYQGPQSRFYEWYNFGETRDEYRCWWNFPDLPEVDEGKASWQDFIIKGDDSVLRHWLRAGAAGYRLDVADELPDEVLALMRHALKEEDGDKVLLGEVWEDAVEKTSHGLRRRYALGTALDSVMNYPLRTALLDFLLGRSSSRALAEFLLLQRLNYPPPLYYSLMNLLSSHDVERIRTALSTKLDARALTREQQAGFLISEAQDEEGAALQALAAVLQFTLPGVPSIYYGDETGMQGMLDPFDRAPFHEGRRPQTELYARLSALRGQEAALSTGALGLYSPQPDIVCLLRVQLGGRDLFGEEAGDGIFLVAVNRSKEARSGVCDLLMPNAGLTAAELSALSEAAPSRGVCVLSGEELELHALLAKLSLPPMSARIYRLT